MNDMHVLYAHECEYLDQNTTAPLRLASKIVPSSIMRDVCKTVDRTASHFIQDQL